jgi:lysozyme
MNIPQLIEQLKRHEGFRANIYKDIVGVNTRGYGENLEIPVSEKKAEAILIFDVNECIKQVMKHEWFTELNDIRQNVIINMVYNIGLQGLLQFKKMIQAIQDEDFEKASKEMLDSKWSQQTGKRSIELSLQMKTGA